LHKKFEKIDTILYQDLNYVIKELSPKVIIVYGSAPKEIFDKYRKKWY